MSFVVWPRPTTIAATRSLLALQTLYESSIAFGMRKALMTEQGKGEMETHITQLEGNVKDLERQVTTLPRWWPLVTSGWALLCAATQGCCRMLAVNAAMTQNANAGVPPKTVDGPLLLNTVTFHAGFLACACRLRSGSSSAR